MIRKEKEGIQWLEFELLTDIPHVIHGVFLRRGGVSDPPFDSLNLGNTTGDEQTKVAYNRQRILGVLSLEKLIFASQIHGNEIIEVPSEDLTVRRSCDGLITRLPNIGLAIQHADCQAAIFYDPIQKIIANVHCGWRGSIQNIYAKTIMQLRSQPENLLVCISPSLGPTAAEFIHYQTELPTSFFPFQVNLAHFDFWAISRMQLQQAGILPHHIEIASLCTVSNPRDFFSYRREKKTGRNATVVGLRERG